MKEKISIIVPAYNEEENIFPFYNSVKDSLPDIDYELIFVNDGSEDKTFEEMKKIQDPRIALLSQEHKGKDYALYSGIMAAKNGIIATLDADLQSDPAEMPVLLDRLNQGNDFVCGWRSDRKDGIVKKISSKIGNSAQRAVLGIRLHDSNSPMKVFRKECVSDVVFFRHFHRFLVALASIQGFKVCEEKISHLPRRFGKSKYGISNRIFGNLKILLALRFSKAEFFK